MLKSWYLGSEMSEIAPFFVVVENLGNFGKSAGVEDLTSIMSESDVKVAFTPQRVVTR